MPIITDIEQQKHDSERVNLYVDGRFSCGLSTILIVARGLRVGTAISEAALQELQRDDTADRAYSAALNFLSIRPRSAREIRDYFRKRHTEDAIASAVVQRLERAGLLDDSQFARFWVDNRQTFRPRGRRALRSEMRQKGLADDVIDEALEGLGDEDVTAYDVGVKKARSYDRDDEPIFFRKMTGFLQRRGFSFEVAARAARRIWTETRGLSDTSEDE